mmetsp:Transcript_21058/g.51812  ORF Transcript_21058/g.51812 Transcript_21058/m.51812 type:complete len:437 (+) Transcript_21058:285-1595(+)
MKQHVPKSCQGLTYHAVMTESDTIEETIEALHQAANGLPIVSVICGGEAGVDLTDKLSEEMGLLSNGTQIANRRDKKVQQEIIHEAGIRSCRQAGGSKLSEVDDFLKKESYPLIVKPGDSAGSDGVKLCHSYEEARDHFIYLTEEHQLVNGGGTCDEVLCQEFLQGREYVVDQVSLNGEHKVMMVWVYDKRPANGGSFVYFGDIPIESDTPEAQQLIPYARQVLDALGVKHGPSHGEFILTKDGPCLVEMNCRCHGGDGIWERMIAGMTGGYNQVLGTVACFLDKDQFHKFPAQPGKFQTHGQCVDMVSFSEGIIKSTPGYDRIRNLPSFVHLESSYGPGKMVHKTVDMITDIGSLIVMHSDPKILAEDVAIIRSLEKSNAMFEYETGDTPTLIKKHLSLEDDFVALERKLSDAMQPSMYLERKLSIPREPRDMYM